MTEFARFQAAIDVLLALSPDEQAAYLHDRFDPAHDDRTSPSLHLVWALPPDTEGAGS